MKPLRDSEQLARGGACRARVQLRSAENALGSAAKRLVLDAGMDCLQLLAGLIRQCRTEKSPSFEDALHAFARWSVIG